MAGPMLVAKKMTPAPAIGIRPIRAFDEIRAVVELQKEVWGFNDVDVVPLQMLVPAAEFGGTLIGAFDGDALVGFVFGFVAREHGQLLIHSQMLAVRAAYRSSGLGCRLKLAQREQALNGGITRINWTVDPLQTANGHLNFAKLGATCNSYRVNFYGESTSSFLHDNGTDRLLMSWKLDSMRVAERLEQGFDEQRALEEAAYAPALLQVDANGEPCSASLSDACVVRIEVPLIGQPANPASWRLAARQAFLTALNAGYVVTEFCRDKHGVYLLKRQSSSARRA